MFLKSLVVLVFLGVPALWAQDTVTLRNENWTRVVVEVRKGNAGNPNQDPVYPGSPFTFIGHPTSRSLSCSAREGYVDYRRDRNPDHPTGQWTEWTRISCTGHGDSTRIN
jgi:hypothetical protein